MKAWAACRHCGQAQEAWRDFADLMRDVADSAADLDAEDRKAPATQVDTSLAELHQAGGRVIAGAAGAILYVAVMPQDPRRDTRMLFAGS